ncbi:2-keto-4-pentenoate hydratase [Halopseudomonas xinjiangensis]|uniref:2-keto-4-pentenoate hydratase n=1 Tax=Halopseudomonas xinjiangensis TaxID=487184 RepID=A0A1H1YZQ2_9GAMM|nr:fumarylacetoacetate hydrolase family protein [Halopseudomonas xinjiangensis]SDT26792.1 2-keto-4-pentenoate hydratase [Halopseudomonas xinjiangensis]
MTDFDTEAAALELFRARLTRKPCHAPGQRFAIDSLARAEQVQSALLAMYQKAGQEIIGYKLGLTDQRAQAATGIGQPLSGALLQAWQYWDGDAIPVAGLIEPRVEAEVAFVMSRTFDDPQAGLAKLLDSLGGALPALEICDSAIEGWPRSLFEALADNLCSGLFVLGSRPVDPRSLDFAGLPMKLSRSGETLAEGNGSQCMGSPLNALLWLARQRAAEGNPLQAGDIVLSGALGPMQPVGRGDQLRLELGALGVLNCRFV